MCTNTFRPQAPTTGKSGAGSKRLLVISILSLVIIGLYGNSLNVPFIFDDHTYIADNPAVKDLNKLMSPDAKLFGGTDADIANNVRTRPLSYLTFGINYALHGFSVQGYHLVNIGLHIANAVLVYLLFSALSRQISAGNSTWATENERSIRHGNIAAFISALLFAVHPVQTNVVTYIIQRMAGLATFWYLLAALLYVSWRINGNRGWMPYIGALAASVAGMLSKEICFTLPVMLVVLELSFFSGKVSVRLAKLAPFLATMAIIPLRILGIAMQSGATLSSALFESINLVNFEHAMSPYRYFVTQLPVVITYLRILVVPHDLHLDRYFPLYRSLGQSEVLLSGLFLLSLLVGAGCLLTMSRRGRSLNRLCTRMAAFGIIWFFVALSVESSFIPINSVIFEYRLYLPSLGFFCAVTYGICGLLAARRGFLSHRMSVIATLLTTTAVVLYAATTIVRNRTWQDDELFWRDAITKSPEKYGNYVSLAHVLRDRGRIDEAVEVMRGQTERNPELVHPVYEIGALYLDAGNPMKAIDYLFAALARRPDKPEIYRELTIALLAAGNETGAVALYRRARALFPAFRPIREMELICCNSGNSD